MPRKTENGETSASVPPRRNISEIKNKQRRAEAYRQMKQDQKKVVNALSPYYRPSAVSVNKGRVRYS